MVEPWCIDDRVQIWSKVRYVFRGDLVQQRRHPDTLNVWYVRSKEHISYVGCLIVCVVALHGASCVCGIKCPNAFEACACATDILQKRDNKRQALLLQPRSA